MAEVRFGAEDGGTFIDVPLDVPAGLGRARAAFDGAAFSHRRGWVDSVTEAERPETCARRIGRVVEQVLARA